MKLIRLILMTLTAAATLFALPAGAAPHRLHGHVPPATMTLNSVGDLPAGNTLRLAIELPLQNETVLSNLLVQLYDPSSSAYHQFLTSDQFADQFGPSTDDYKAVKAFAAAHHLTVVGEHSNRTLLDVTGSVADIEKAFNIHMKVYKHPTESRTFYAPDVDPTLDLDVPVRQVLGLNNYSLPHPTLHPMPQGGPVKPLGGQGPEGTFIGNDFRNAYAPGVTNQGNGQYVGLLEFDGYFTNDIYIYEQIAGLPKPYVPLSNVIIDSATNFPSSDGGAIGEVSLDIEMAISMAQNLSGVLVYEANVTAMNPAPAYDLLNKMATDNKARQLSSSWVWLEFFQNSDQIFQQMAAQGQSFFQASGDSDAYTGWIEKPSDDPYVTVVGGTTLTTSPNGAWASETVWNDENGTGSSGGVSTTYAIPWWQQGINMSTNGGSTTLRNIPDVAAVANNIWVNYDNGNFGPFQGTSCAAPLWAAFTALANQQAVINGLAQANGQTNGIGFINPLIYALGKSSGYSSYFHDITTGNNMSTNSPTEFSAVAGYDLCTGWGTPGGANLLNALAGSTTATNSPSTNTAVFIASLSVVPGSDTCVPTINAIDPGGTVTVNVGLANAVGINTNLALTLTIPAGTTNGVDGVTNATQVYPLVNSTVSTQQFTFSTMGTCGTSFPLVFTWQDTNKNSGTLTYTLPFGETVTAEPLYQDFSSALVPALPAGWSSSASGSYILPWQTLFASGGSNAIWATEPGYAGISDLYSPAFPVSGTNAQLIFNHVYQTEADYDGGVLDIKIGNGGFTDILSAGGVFVSGGYNATLSSSTGNPLGGRQSWTGTSSPIVNTVVDLPASAAGNQVSFRWRFGTDLGVAGSGWVITTVQVNDPYSACSACTNAQPILVQPKIIGNNFIFSFQSASNQNYEVQYRPGNGNSWTTVQTLAGNGKVRSVTNAAATVQGWFRVIAP
jgi:hypothetical protein